MPLIGGPPLLLAAVAIWLARLLPMLLLRWLLTNCCSTMRVLLAVGFPAGTLAADRVWPIADANRFVKLQSCSSRREDDDGGGGGGGNGDAEKDEEK